MIQFPPMETFDDGELLRIFRNRPARDGCGRCLQKNIDRGHITDPRPFVDRVTTFITK